MKSSDAEPRENQIDISALLATLKQGRDVIVKSFPSHLEVERGSDVDVYTLDKPLLVQELMEITAKNFDWEIKMIDLGPSQTHIDFFDDEFLFKLDLYSDFPAFSRFNVREGIFREVVLSGIGDPGVVSNGPPRPSRVYSAFVRYMEFLEFFWAGGEKSHHLDWIFSNLDSREIEHVYELSHWALRPNLSPVISKSQGFLDSRIVWELANIARKSTLLVRVANWAMKKSPGLGNLAKRILG